MGEEAGDCKARLKQVMPPEPWTKSMPLKAFDPLREMIEQYTQSDLFRGIGDRYKNNSEDYSQFVKELDDANQDSGKKTLANGVDLEVHQSDGIPTLMIFDDKQEDRKETVTFNEISGYIESDKVEHCGVSRFRQFSRQGEVARTYTFDGGSLSRSGSTPPELKLDEK